MTTHVELLHQLDAIRAKGIFVPQSAYKKALSLSADAIADESTVALAMQLQREAFDEFVSGIPER